MNKIKWFLNLPFVAKWVNHSAGGVIQNGVGALIGAACAALQHWTGYTLTPEKQQWLDAGLVGSGAFLVTTTVQYFQTGNNNDLLSALGLEKPDGHIGPVAIATARVATLATDADVAKTLGTNYTPQGYKTAAGK